MPPYTLKMRLQNSPLTSWAWRSQRTPEGYIKPVNLARWILCRLGLHDWRYASRYTKPGYESRARCQSCEARKWVATA